MSETMLIMYAALGAELLLLLFVLLTVSWFRKQAARRRDGKAIRALVARIRKGKTEREAAIERFLSDGMGLSGEPLARAKTDVLRAQLVLLQRFAAIYQSRDAAAAEQFDADLAAALIAYHQLQNTAAPAAEAPDVTVIDATELNDLRAENKRLADELSATMQTMSRMLNEYTSIFSGIAATPAAPIAGHVATLEAAPADAAPAADPPGPESAEAVPEALQPVDGGGAEEAAGGPPDGDFAAADADTMAEQHAADMEAPEPPPESARSTVADLPGPTVVRDAVTAHAWPVPGIEVDEGDDLEASIGVWEEGPVEVVGFDLPDDEEVPLRRQSGG